MKSLSN